MSSRAPLWLSWAAALGALVHLGQSYLWPQEAWYALLAAVLWAALPWPRGGTVLGAGWFLWLLAGLVATLMGIVPKEAALVWGLRGDLILGSGMLVGGWLAAREAQELRPEWAAPWVVAAAGALGLGFLQAVGVLQAPIDPYGAADAAGGLGLSNFTAEWAAVALPLAAALAAPGLQSRLGGAGLALTAGFALLARARAGLAAAVLAASAAFGHGRRGGKALVAVSAVVVLGAATYLLLRDPTGSYRSLLWRDSVRVLAQVPLGVGPGGFSRGLDLVLSPELDRRSWERNIYISHAHNLVVEALVERGPLGLLAWLLLAAAAARGAWRRRHDSRLAWVAAAAVAWAVAAAVSLVRPVPSTWWLGGVVLGWLATPALATASSAPAQRLRKALRAVAAITAVALAVIAWHGALTDRLARAALAEAAADRPDQAERALLEALARDPDNESLWFNLGLVRLRMKDQGGAIDALRRAGSVRPTWARPNEAVTVLAAELGQWEIAREAVVRWQMLPGAVDTAVYRAAVAAYAADEQYAEAWRLLNQGLAQSPDDLELLRAKARLLGLEERWEQAAQVFDVILENPQATARDKQLAEIARQQAGR